MECHKPITVPLGQYAFYMCVYIYIYTNIHIYVYIFYSHDNDPGLFELHYDPSTFPLIIFI